MDFHEDATAAEMQIELNANGVTITPTSHLAPVALMRNEVSDRVVGAVLYDPTAATELEHVQDVLAWLTDVRAVIEATHALGGEWKT